MTDTTAVDLADFLREKVEAASYRKVEAATGISRGSLENIIRRENKEPPELPTLEKIADTYGIPLVRVMEMAGFTSELPSGAELRLLQDEARANPELRTILEAARDLSEEQRRVLAAYARYLLDQERQRREPPA
jgi:transcriptional regulator with XRE-family HTH domain